MNKPTAPLYISGLADFCSKYPLDEKVLIACDGRQLLENLVGSGTPWLNFHAASSVALATAVIEENIIKDNYKVLSSLNVLIVIHDIFIRLAEIGKLKYFKKHSVNKGIVEALSLTIGDLRMAGFEAKTLDKGAFIDKRKGDDIVLLLSEYENYLKNNHLIDGAKIILLALDAVKNPRPASDIKYAILSRAQFHGVEKDFLLGLTGGHIAIIDETPVFGIPQPYQTVSSVFPAAEHFPESGSKTTKPKKQTDIEHLKWLFQSSGAPVLSNDGTINLFSAIGYRNEIKEILRRITAKKIPIDDVEIVCADDDVYGNEIYSLCRKLEVPVTFANGLSANTSSPARAIIGFLMWIKEDFSEVYLRRVLEQGDLIYDDSDDAPNRATLALLLRTSGISWGRERYALMIDQDIAERKTALKTAEAEGEADDAQYLSCRIKALKALKKYCTAILDLVPDQDTEGKIDYPALCEGCLTFLNAYAKIRSSQDAEWSASAKDFFKMASRLLSQKVSLEEAVETLLSAIIEIKTGCSGPLPGQLHVTHFRTSGRSNRKNVFVVGLDETRFPGSAWQDPVLLDHERVKLGKELILSEVKLKSNLYLMACLLSDLQGRVTLSYSAYDTNEARKVFPSSLLLQAFRIKSGDPSTDYKQLFSALGQPAGYSADSLSAIDETDWWLKQLLANDAFKDGRESVINIYPGLQSGLIAEDARNGETWTEYEGMVTPAGKELDPRDNKDMVLSCSRIEEAAKCPFKYFMKYVLQVKALDETEKDTTVWLDPLTRGSLMHEVFHIFGQGIIDGIVPEGKEDRLKYIEKIFNEVVEGYKINIPVNSVAVFNREYEEMKSDLQVFLTVNDELGTVPVYCEQSFGLSGQKPVAIDIGAGKSVQLRGTIDRIDKSASGAYHVWDYKTGSSYSYEENKYISGAEQIQHVLYAKVAEQMISAGQKGKKTEVEQSGYIFPTSKSEKRGKTLVFKRDPSLKDKWQPALNKLLDMVSAGRFIMNAESSCASCDYLPVCGADSRKKTIKSKTGREKQDWEELKTYE